MKTEILLFGQLEELTGQKRLSMEGFSDTASLIEALHKQYPVLAQSKYVVALDQQIVTENKTLTTDSVVALLPPFSGG